MAIKKAVHHPINTTRIPMLSVLFTLSLLYNHRRVFPRIVLHFSFLLIETCVWLLSLFVNICDYDDNIMIILRILYLNQSIPESHTKKKSLRLLKSKIPNKITSFISPFFVWQNIPFLMLTSIFDTAHIYPTLYIRLLLAKHRIPLNIVGISLFNRKAKEIKKSDWVLYIRNSSKIYEERWQ